MAFFIDQTIINDESEDKSQIFKKKKRNQFVIHCRLTYPITYLKSLNNENFLREFFNPIQLSILYSVLYYIYIYLFKINLQLTFLY